MGPMAQWREQCRVTRRMEAHPPTPGSTHTLHILPEHPPLPNPCPPLTPLSTHLPSWPDEPTPFLVTQEPPSFPQGNNIVMTLRWLNEAGEGLTDKALLEWALDILRSPEDWRWLWSLEPVETPSSSLTQSQPLPPWYGVSNVSPPNTSALNALSTSAPFATLPPPDIPNGPVSCNPVPYVESSVMWAPVVQPQPQLTHPLSLPKWVTWEDLDLVPQGYNRGNVTIEEAPTSFSPFSSVDCMLFSHFSFDDFITIAFPDLVRDLGIQI